MMIKIVKNNREYRSLVGQRFDKLLVLELVEKNYRGLWWLCVCNCGNTLVRNTSNLNPIRRNKTVAACRNCRPISQAKMRHGFSKQDGKIPKIYKTWSSMRARCYRKTATSYPSYGALGIRVCKEWMNFESFKNWSFKNGFKNEKYARKKNLSIDRIDPTRNYQPDNCRWIPLLINQRQKKRPRGKCYGRYKAHHC